MYIKTIVDKSLKLHLLRFIFHHFISIFTWNIYKKYKELSFHIYSKSTYSKILNIYKAELIWKKANEKYFIRVV